MQTSNGVDSGSDAQNLKKQLLATSRKAFVAALARFAEDIGLSEPEWLGAMASCVEEQFDELIGLRDRRGFESAKGLTASRISLVHEHDLEFSLELAELAKRVRELCETELPRLHVRFMVLLGQRDAADEQCPVGPEAACASLRALADAVGFDGVQRLRMVDRSAEPLAVRLLELYRELNQVFADAGVVRQKAADILHRTGGPRDKVPYQNYVPSKDDGRATQGGEFRPFQAYPEQVSKQGGAGGGVRESGGASPGLPGLPPAEPDDPLTAFREQLMRRKRQSSGAGAELDASMTAAMLTRARNWLAEFHLKKPGGMARLSSTELVGLLPVRVAAMVEAVEQMFNAIAVSELLPQAMRKLIASLQVPYLRLTLDDEGAVTDPAHPARKLLDGLALLAATLPPEVTFDHPLAARLHAIVKAVHKAGGPGSDPFGREVFEKAVVATGQIIEERAARTRKFAEDLSDATERADRREDALVFASSAVLGLIDNQTQPAVRNFISHWWIQLLARVVYTHGSTHSSWQEAIELAEQLIDSAVVPKDENQRRRWAAGLAPLIKALEKGLASLGLAEAARRKLLGQCMDLHAALLVGKVPPEITLEPILRPEWSSVRGAIPLTVLQHPALAPVSIAAQPVAQAEPGEWLLLPGPEGAPFRGEVAAVGKSGRVLLLVDPEKGQVLGVTRRALADLSSRRLASRLGCESLIERVSEDLLRRTRAAS